MHLQLKHNHCLTRLLSIIFLINFFLINKAFSQLSLAGIFTDNAIFQQDKRIPIWGKSRPNTQIVIQFANHEIEDIADESGNWKVFFPKMKADGKEYTLSVTSDEEKISVKGIKIGEVWLASGQSNMQHYIYMGVDDQEKVIAEANDADIRFFNAGTALSSEEQHDMESGKWILSSSETIGGFSAVAYFFAKNLRKQLNVPIGIIVAARGGTNIESWISRNRLNTFPQYRESLEKIRPELWNKKVSDAERGNIVRDSLVKHSFNGIKEGVLRLKYNDQKWDKANFPFKLSEMKNYGGYWGLVWIRKKFNVSREQLTDNWEITLPMYDMENIIYINGKQIGRKTDSAPLKMELDIPKGILHKGENILTIRMYTAWGIGAIGDNVSNKECFLLSDKGNKISLDGEWKLSNLIEPHAPAPSTYYSDPTVNFNSMISPVIGYGIKGFIWYQGEGNTLDPKGYSLLQSALIDDWRIRWEQGYLPFLYVQLANHMQYSEKPLDYDGWAVLRDEQTKVLSKVPSTGMAVTIDIGEWNNVHPKNKQDVGLRLSLEARKIAYGYVGIPSSPQYDFYELKGSKLLIHFKDYAEGLKVNKGNKVEGFAIKDKDGKWHWANAVVQGKDVISIDITGFNEIKGVQYAWQANPIVNLYNSWNLPAVPFNIKID